MARCEATTAFSLDGRPDGVITRPSSKRSAHGGEADRSGRRAKLLRGAARDTEPRASRLAVAASNLTHATQKRNHELAAKAEEARQAHQKHSYCAPLLTPSTSDALAPEPFDQASGPIQPLPAHSDSRPPAPDGGLLRFLEMMRDADTMPK